MNRRSGCAAVDLAIVLAVFALGFLAVPIVEPILRHGRNLAAVLSAATFQFLVEGAAPFTLMAARGEVPSSYGLLRHNLGKSLGLGLVLSSLYDLALSWHTAALLWVPLRRQSAVRISFGAGLPISVVAVTVVLLVWGFTEGFFGIYFAKKVNLVLGHSGAGWCTPGVFAFALFNGVVHLLVGQGWEGFITSFASGYAITMVPAVTGNAWGGVLVQTLTNAVGRL